MSKEILLTKGCVTIVDDEDYEWLAKRKWYASREPDGSKPVYAMRRMSQSEPNTGKVVAMQNLILPPPEGLFIDHINGDGLDNRRCNLRYVTMRQNNLNSPRRKDGQSRYKGVSYGKASGTWRANIYLGGRQCSLGVFDTEEAAAWAYNNAARDAYGEYAFLNEVSEKAALPKRNRHRKGSLGRGRVGIPWFHVHFVTRLQKWQLHVKAPHAQEWYGRTKLFNSLEEAREFARGIYASITMAPSG